MYKLFSSLAVGGGSNNSSHNLHFNDVFILYTFCLGLKLIKRITYIFKLIYFIQQLFKQVIHLILVYTFAQALNVHCISISQVQLTKYINYL